jgi:glycine oxidase
MTLAASAARDLLPGIWDYIIVGQGLAGTTLAWQLLDAGCSVLVIDAEHPITTSKIAAGLITPITGQRLALSWRVDEMLPAARTFFARVEAKTQQSFFHDRTAVRLFKSDLERVLWTKRKNFATFQAHLVDPQPDDLLDAALGDASGGGFHMKTAQLDVAGYLAASRAHFNYESHALDWRRDVDLTGDVVSAGPHRARRIISCEGFAATRNPYFSWVPFKGAKGDILTVRFDRPVPPQCLHRGIWVVPTSDPQVFRVGATYDWRTLDQVPSVDGRAEIESRLTAFFRVPYTVISHQAAVRPIIRESKAVMGLHPVHQQLGFFNGLGSKGSLHAPWFAGCFAGHLVHGAPLPPAFDVRKHIYATG